MNPQAPKLYGLIKLHKINHPIRPVVSFISSPVATLAQKLNKILINNINFSPKFTLKNSYDLIEKTKNIKLPNNSKFVSFDVTNLFTKVPVKETIDIIKNLLTQKTVNPVVASEILNLLEICISKNYFIFNNKLYNQTDGLAMGNPLSPLLADIFMDNLENKISKLNNFKNCLYWFRYVDDILIAFTGTDRQLNKFFKEVNNIHPQIKFTMEVETDKCINFLDLTIKNCSNKHDFSIYRKNTQSDTTIHASSFHPLAQKLAAYKSMIHRLVSIPMNNNNYNKELNIIYQIAINNGFKAQTITNILNQKQKQILINKIFPKNKDNQKTFVSLTFTTNKVNLIAKEFKKLNVNVAFKTNNSLGKFIKNNKDKIKKEDKSGVYKINCGTCNNYYIGQTGRSFKQRLNEHKKSFNNKDTKSNYANHLINERHSFGKNFEILHLSNKGKLLDILEQIEINRHKHNGKLLNEQVDFFNSPLVSFLETVKDSPGSQR